MSLRVAVQMDPMAGVNINGDSSFALMIAAQARGYDVWHYDVGTLTLDANDRLIAFAHPVHDLQRVAGAHAADVVCADLLAQSGEAFFGGGRGGFGFGAAAAGFR